ncbi:MAG: RNA polymerase sigma factor [Paraglaciecola sp.]|uniref:RNA polymerase sigma factor n=1 Tax=Paraglaciecola sp. TaxID=1920173 RepID=UPI00329826E8
MPNIEKSLSVFSVFVECKSSLRSMVSKYLSQKNDIEDVVQETFTRTYAADKKGSIEHPKLYLFKTAKHLVLRENTKITTRLTEYLDDSLMQTLVTDETPAIELLSVEQNLELLQQALASLPVQCGKVTSMRIVDGLKVKDIASQLDLSISTVEKHLAKGFERCDQYVRRATSSNQQQKAQPLPLKRNVK